MIVAPFTSTVFAKDIIHDAAFQILQKQHGKRPNIIHIMRDDMKSGAIGHPTLNKVSGSVSPNINKIAVNGRLCLTGLLTTA